MWRCKFCDKTNLDDQKICPYCTAPNPDAPKAKPEGAPQSPVQPRVGVNPPVQDWNTRYNPDPKATKKPIKLDTILKYMVIAATALLIVYLATLLFQRQGTKSDAANAQSSDQSLTGQKQTAQDAMEKEKPTPTSTPVPIDTPQPTRKPIVIDAVTELYLDFEQTYQCSTSDFDLPYDIPNDEVTWRCAKNDTSTTCSKDGLILAGNIQVDSEKRYNDEIIVTGTTKEGSVLTYHVITGDGAAYVFNWSTSSRTMRGRLSGYVMVSDTMVEQCNGFSIYYEYKLASGKLDANAWSVWVREDGTTWVRVQDIVLKNEVGELFDITFDRPITFNEIWIMPESYSLEFSFNSSFYVSYLIFD